MTPLGARLLNTVETTANAEGDSSLQLEASADTRVALYRIAFDMVRDRPVLGIGPDSFLAGLPRYRSDAEPYGVQDTPATSAHSWIAQVAATSGALGLTAFIGIAVVALALTFRRGFLPDAWAALGMLGAFLGAGVTTVNAIATDWLFWASIGVVAGTTSRQTMAEVVDLAGTHGASPRRARAAAAAPKSKAGSIIAFACVALGLIAALTSTNAIQASRAAKTSQIARLRGQAQVAIASGLRATGSDSLRPQYWDTLGLAYISGDRVSEAVSAFERASKLAPYDVRYDGDLARALALLAQRGDKTSAVRATEVADRVVRTDPNNPLAQQTRAVVMQFTDNLPEALKSSQRAIALDRTSEVGYTTNLDFYITGLQVLNALGRPLDAVTLARASIAKAPNPASEASLRLELARALMASGQLNEALTEVDRVLALQPGQPAAQQLRAQLLAALAK